MASVDDFLASLPSIDWSDRQSAYIVAKDILSRMARDREQLRVLLDAAVRDPRLRSMHECHTFDDKIVLVDALEAKCWRIRFRLGKQAPIERVHNHRFDAVHWIITGSYLHKIYQASLDDAGAIVGDSVRLLAIKNEKAGTAILISSDVFHTTASASDTVSLLLRGPVKREKAAQLDFSSGAHSSQQGVHTESPGKRLKVAMSQETLQSWVAQLERMGVI